MNKKQILNIPAVSVILSIILIPVWLISCDKTENENTPDLTANVIVDDTSTGSSVIIDNITEKIFTVNLLPGQEMFDWEKLLLIPSETGPIPMPWNESASTTFSDHFKNDIKKSDGWELYLSTFSTEQYFSSNPWFFLYNKYRGVIRFYYYCNAGATSNQLEELKDYNIFTHKIHTGGSHSYNSPLLNFAQQSIVDIGKKSTLSQAIEQVPFSDYIWYSWEYELAFDQDIYNQNSQSFMLGTALGLSKMESLIINDKAYDKLDARIRFSDYSGNIKNFSGNVSLIINDKNDISRLSNILSPSDREHLNKIMNHQVFSSMLSGVADKNSSGIIHWNAQLSLRLAPNGLGMPGSSYGSVVSGADNSIMQGLRPFYNRALGVFYLNAKPRVNHAKLSESNFQYTLDAGSVEYLFNPAVLQIADIQNIKQELVATQGEEISDIDGRKKLYTGQKLTSDKELHIQGVRVSFDVVPKNGDKVVHITKTFKAEIVSIK